MSKKMRDYTMIIGNEDHMTTAARILSGDNPAASERQGADDAGPENSGPMGNQSTQRPQSSGEAGVPDAVFDSHQSAGNGNGRADRESRSEHERAGNAGTPGVNTSLLIFD